jgi:parallel beta-helix repeat protein
VTTWYVDSAGGLDTNDGRSHAAPFLTLQRAHDQTVPGDIVSVLPGKGYGGGSGGAVLLRITRSGSANNPITYQAYPGTRPIIRSTQAWQSFMILANWIVVQGFEFAGHQGAGTLAGAQAMLGAGTWGSSPLYCGNAIHIGDTSERTVYHHVTVNDCWMHDYPGGAADAFFTDYITFSNNVVYNNAFYSSYACSGLSIFRSQDIDKLAPTKNFVTGNVCYGNQNLIGNHNFNYAKAATNAITPAGTRALRFAATSGIAVGAQIANLTHPATLAANSYVAATTATTVTMSQNAPLPVSSGDALVFASISDGEGIIIDTCNAHAYAGRTRVQNNLCVNNGSGGIYITSSPGCDVIGNTCYLNQSGWQSGQYGYGGEIYNSPGSEGTIVANNIIWANGTYPKMKDDGAATVFSNIVNGGNGVAVPGIGNVVADPLFISAGIDPAVWDFRTKPTSPARGYGSVLSGRRT